MKQAAASAAIFLGVALLYSKSQGLDVPFASQAAVAGVLGLSSLVVSSAPLPDSNPAVKALTTGSIFAGAMYALGNSDDVVAHAVIGTLSSYGASMLVSETKNEGDINELEF
jgi:energy-converting hydrogenase Eha subunit A